MKFSIKDFSSKYKQIHRKLRIWSHLLEKLFMENFIFCAVMYLKISWRQRKEIVLFFVFCNITYCLKGLLREKCPNTEIFLIHIFLYSDWIRDLLKHRLQITPYLDTLKAVVDRDITFTNKFLAGVKNHLLSYFSKPKWKLHENPWIKSQKLLKEI